MKRIDVDTHVIVFIECGDHLHRYAVPAHLTCSVVAGKAFESVHKKEERRNQQFTLADDTGRVLQHDAPIGSLFADGGRATVVPLKEEG